MRRVRFRTLGCYPLTGAVASEADTLDEDHCGDARRRACPSGKAVLIDHDESASMEKKKREGYF